MNPGAKYFLGCPVWACEAWRGKLFAPAARRKEWLNAYSRVFNTVEGNTTFYALPTIETVQKWAHETTDGFRFALKVPRVISHDCRLVGCRLELEKFIECLEILNDADRLGPTFLQLPPDFAQTESETLKQFLRQWPANLPLAVEVRHADFFTPSLGKEFQDFLRERSMDRVVFDSTALFHFPPADLTESEARRRKPKVPVQKQAVGPYPFVRLIGVNQVEKLQPWIDDWSQTVVSWIEAGKTPFVFTHTPNDEFAPDFAKLFHQAVRKRLTSIPELPEVDFSTETQLNLFADGN